MKQLLVNALLSFVTGACFCLGVILVLSFFEYGQYNDKRIHIGEPEGFVFSEHEIYDGEANFTVKGKIENISENEWSRAQLKVKIYAGNAYMTECENSISYIGPKSIRDFTIVCYDTAGSNLPQNISYKLSVRSGTK